LFGFIGLLDTEAANITFTINDSAIANVVDAMKGLYPIPYDTNGVPEFSDNAWAKECIRVWIKRQVSRWNDKSAIDSIKAYNDSLKNAEEEWIQ